MRKYLLILGLLLNSLAFGADEPAEKSEAAIKTDKHGKYVKAYDLKNLAYDEIKDLLANIQSKPGSITYIKSQHRLMVYDIPQVHKHVQDMLKEAGGPAVNINVEVSFLNAQIYKESGIQIASGTGFHKDARRRPGQDRRRERSIDVQITDKRHERQTTNVIQLLARSGGSAQLWSTESKIDKDFFTRYSLIPVRNGKHGEDDAILVKEFFPDFEEREIGVSLMIEPTYNEATKNVHIYLYPVITSEILSDGKRKKRAFRVDKVKTELIVRDGQSMLVSMGSRHMRQFFRQILPRIAVQKNSVIDNMKMYVKPRVTIMQPPERLRDK